MHPLRLMGNMTEANLIITNAAVFTADPVQPHAEAIAVKGERIVGVGTEQAVLELRTPETAMIDAGGKTLMPGIIDAHFHLLWGAHNLANIDLENLRGLGPLREAIAAFKAEHPDKKILRGGGLGYDVLPGDKRLTRHHIDQLESDIPLILVAFDFHSAWCNTAALKAAGILHGAATLSNAEVVMGSDGLANGELREFEAIHLVTNLIPPLSAREENDLLKQAMAQAHRFGITSVHNMNGNRDEFTLYERLDKAGELSLRVYIPYRMYPSDPLNVIEDEALYLRESYRSDKLKAGALKLFMDGVIESFTAFTLEPYVNAPHAQGSAIFEAEHFNEVAVRADALGLQIAVHAIGDAAVRRTLDGYEAALKTNGRRDSRHRVEHIELLHPADLPRFAELNILASMQPYHCTRPEVEHLTPYLNFLPEARYKDAFPWRSLTQSGAHLCFGSDWPVVNMNPFLGINTAINRQPWLPTLPSESLSLEHTLFTYTRNAAYAEFAEQDKGQLKTGMLADMTLLSANIFATPSEKLKDICVELTLLGGDIVFER